MIILRINKIGPEKEKVIQNTQLLKYALGLLEEKKNLYIDIKLGERGLKLINSTADRVS